MANNFVSGGNGDLQDIYLSEPELLEKFVGNQLWAWGRNSDGQLGTNNITHRSSPVQTVSGGTNWTQVELGNGVVSLVQKGLTAAIKTDGTLWMWGNNDDGELGDNTRTDRSSPVQTVAAGTNWKKVSASTNTNTVVALRISTAAIKTDGTLWTWGNNSLGQLGTNNITHRSSPVQTVSGGTNWKEISVGGAFMGSIKTDGTLWLWGRNTDGQLGVNDVVHRSSPVQVLGGGTDWKYIACCPFHTGAIKTDGTLWMWGDNTNGNLGDGTITRRSSPVQTIAGGNNWKQLSGGNRHTVAIKTDGTLWTWGINSDGQLGDNTRTDRSSPVQTVAGGTNWKQGAAGTTHTAAIKTDGTLWLWGDNGEGRLGDNTTSSKSSPIQVLGGGTYWKQVSARSQHTLAVTFTEA
jgi:alpha-tubulin suppressor-like RCC1 family protein